jgi:hypothetical protein
MSREETLTMSDATTTTPPPAAPQLDLLEKNLLRTQEAIPPLAHTLLSLQRGRDLKTVAEAGPAPAHDGTHELCRQAQTFADLCEAERQRPAAVHKHAHGLTYG